MLAETIEAPGIIHPALRPKAVLKTGSAKQRRTTVRVAKLINPRGNGKGEPVLTQVPIEPSFNNRGGYDPGTPLRHYLDKGFVFPHEFDPVKYKFLYCAVQNCWDPAISDGERCTEHEEMYARGLIRYATVGRAPSE